MKEALRSSFERLGFHGCIQEIASKIVKNIQGKVHWVLFESSIKDVFRAVVCYPECEHCGLQSNPFIHLRVPEAKIPFLVGIEEGRVVIVNDPLTSEYTEYMYALIREKGITAIAFVPFFNKKRALSFLVIDKIGGQFSEQERDFLQQCSDMISGFMPIIKYQPLVQTLAA
jgi:hypothetical protein